MNTSNYTNRCVRSQSSIACVQHVRYTAAKPRGPVTQKHQRTRGCNSHLKAEFCHAQIFGSGASTALPLWLRGVVGATRKDVRTAGSVFLTTTLHPMHSKMQTVVPLIQPGTKP